MNRRGGTDDQEAMIAEGWPHAQLAQVWEALDLSEGLRERFIAADLSVLAPLAEVVGNDAPSEVVVLATCLLLCVGHDNSEDTAREMVGVLRLISEQPTSLLVARTQRWQRHPGPWIDGQVASVRRGLVLLYDVETDLRQLLDGVRDLDALFDAVEALRSDGSAFSRELLKRTVAHLSASNTVLDYCRELAKQTGNAELIAKVDEVWKGGRTAFLRELRNAALHQEVIPMNAIPRPDRGMVGSITLNKAVLERIRPGLEQRNPEAAAYLSEHGNLIDFREVVVGYAEELTAAVGEILDLVVQVRGSTIAQGRHLKDEADRHLAEFQVEARAARERKYGPG